MACQSNKENNEDIPGYERVTKLAVRSILMLGVAGFLMYKFWDAKINIPNFDYLYFLSTVMAIFAIVLSILFYFKSTEHSNEFYNNIFSFTKDTSTILAELKANVGHIEQGVYKSLLPNNDDSKEELEKIKAREQKLKDELNQFIEKNVNDQAMIRQLREKFENASNELSKLEQEKHSLKEENVEIIEPRLFNFLFKRFCFYDGERKQMYIDRPDRLKYRLNRYFSETANDELIRDAKKIGLIDENKRVMQEKLDSFICYLRDK